MSREFEVVVTPEVIEAMAECYDPTWGYPSADIGKEWAAKSLATAITHPDFQRQLRAYVAEQMWGLVPGEQAKVLGPIDDEQWVFGHNACRAETLANITAWEKANEGQ